MRRYSSLWHDDDDQALKRNKLAYMVCSMYVAGSVSKYYIELLRRLELVIVARATTIQ